MSGLRSPTEPRLDAPEPVPGDEAHCGVVVFGLDFESQDNFGINMQRQFEYLDQPFEISLHRRGDLRELGAEPLGSNRGSPSRLRARPGPSRRLLER